MRVVPLGSGSAGNATLVVAGTTHLLLDAGLPARTLAARLHAVGVEPGRLDCLLLSHEHQDHARGVRVFAARHGTPLACSRRTLEAADLSPGHVSEWLPLAPGGSLRIGAARVEAFAVPHDAAEPVGFVVTSHGVRFAAVTDLGQATPEVCERLAGSDALLVEFNHDGRMLRDGPYPLRLQRRVAGRLGHLSNEQAARLLQRTVDAACQGVVLAHLSARNNSERLARSAARRGLLAAGRGDLPVQVAPRSAPGPELLLRRRGPGRRRAAAAQAELFPG